MKAEKVLEIVLREMRAYGNGWRSDWSGFDGRTLQWQLDNINSFAKKALTSDNDIDCTSGTDFKKENCGD